MTFNYNRTFIKPDAYCLELLKLISIFNSIDGIIVLCMEHEAYSE